MALLITCKKGIISYDISQRKKIGRSLLQSENTYNISKWARESQEIVYMSSESKKAKMFFYPINKKVL